MRRTIASRRHPGIALLIAIGFAGLLVHVAWVVGLGQGHFDDLIGNGLYTAVEFLAALICFARAAVSPGERGIWIALGSGLAAWAIGDAYWTLELTGLAEIPYPSISDIFYVVGYPCFYAAILMLIGRRVKVTASAWIDGIIGGLGSAALAAALLAPALVGLTEGDVAAVVTNLAYPVGDILLLSFLVAGMVLAGGRLGTVWIPIALGLAITAVADGVFLYAEATGFYSPGILDSMWLLGALLVAGSSLGSLRRREAGRAQMLSIVVPGGFALIAITILAWDQFQPVGAASASLAVATLCLVVIRLVLSSRENASLLRVVHDDSITDALTGLGNRRAVMRDLERTVHADAKPAIVAIFDLDGFKSYNDAFGHPAGDMLLRRMGARLAAAVEPGGRAYRLGGDEFCVIADVVGSESELLDRAGMALSESGEGFEITASSGFARTPLEASSPSTALGIADARMYARKGLRPSSAQRQTHDVLLRILREREPDLGAHMSGVAGLAVEMGRQLELDAEGLDVLARAAELHDVGKIAIPDRVLRKPAPLDAAEWELMRSHTIIGQRILMAAPALAPVARLVRSSHEHWDGSSYPDGLRGDEIPLGARVILICDAFEAITADRAYRPASTAVEAIAELRRCAGAQFDPALVEVFCKLVYPRIENGSGRYNLTGRGITHVAPAVAA